MIKVNVDKCDGCVYLHGDQDGESYYQYCAIANGCPSFPETWTELKELSCCPIDYVM